MDEFGQPGHQGLTMRQLGRFVPGQPKKRDYSWILLCVGPEKRGDTTKSEFMDMGADTGDRDRILE